MLQLPRRGLREGNILSVAGSVILKTIQILRDGLAHQHKFITPEGQVHKYSSFPEHCTPAERK